MHACLWVQKTLLAECYTCVSSGTDLDEAKIKSMREAQKRLKEIDAQLRALQTPRTSSATATDHHEDEPHGLLTSSRLGISRGYKTPASPAGNDAVAKQAEDDAAS